MARYYYVLALITLPIYLGIASAQNSYPIMEKIAQKVIQKYQTSSCEQLAMEKPQRPGKKRSWRRMRWKYSKTTLKCALRSSTWWQVLSPTNCSNAV
ncbi:MAG: hypothetical protein ACREOW_17335 [Thermodesulfobacteriota bacterium]